MLEVALTKLCTEVVNLVVFATPYPLEVSGGKSGKKNEIKKSMSSNSWRIEHLKIANKKIGIANNHVAVLFKI
jgi:hypothetical protein